MSNELRVRLERESDSELRRIAGKLRIKGSAKLPRSELLRRLLDYDPVAVQSVLDAALFTFDVFVASTPSDRTHVDSIIAAIKDNALNVISQDLLASDVDANAAHGQTKIRAAQNPEAKLDQALARSRSLLLVVSLNALTSEWLDLERKSHLFRDPSRPERKFVPIIIDDCLNDLPVALQRYRLLDFRRPTEDSYRELIALLKNYAKTPVTPLPHESIPKSRLLEDAFIVKERVLEGDILPDVWKLRARRKVPVRCLRVANDNRRTVVASENRDVHLWDAATGSFLGVFQEHAGTVLSISFSPDGRYLATASDRGTVRIWDMLTGDLTRQLRVTVKICAVEWAGCASSIFLGTEDGDLLIWDIAQDRRLCRMQGHSAAIRSICVIKDAAGVITASADRTLRLWDVGTASCVATLKGHTAAANSVVAVDASSEILSASDDTTLRLWSLSTVACLATLEGHRGPVAGVAVSRDGRFAVSGANDGQLMFWDLVNRYCFLRSEVHSGITTISLSYDSQLLTVGCNDGDVRVFRVNVEEGQLDGFSAFASTLYTNAKVVLVGESGIGKSCLGHRLVQDKWIVEESTHGMRVWPLNIGSTKSSAQGVLLREVWLWDLAGQAEYRLVHQLFLDETSIALVLFDPSNPDDPFEGIGHWEKALRVAIGGEPVRILVATKCDRGAATITQKKLDDFCGEHGYAAFISTSSKTGIGRGELLQAISQFIPWDRTPVISTPTLFKRLKDKIVQIRDEGLVLIPFSALRQQLNFLLSGERFDQLDLRTVVRLLAGQGLIKLLDFGDFVLLKPELMNDYAAAAVRAAREHVDGIGCISERAVLEGDFDFKDMSRLSKADEDILLRAVVQTFVDQSLCIRQDTPAGPQLVFPSQFNRELELPEHPTSLVTYRFAGHLPTIYTTLVVRLRYSGVFEEPELWKNAAVFRGHSGHRMGLTLNRVGDGVGELNLFFECNVGVEDRITLLKFVHEHLRRHAIDVCRQRHYVCPNSKCGRPFENHLAVVERAKRGYTFVRCVWCDRKIPFLDLIEQKFGDHAFETKVEQLERDAQINLDNESKELILVGHAFVVAGEAGQIFRPTPIADHGIDGEIEFKDNRGQASGRRIYLQLKSGDSYLQERKDGREVFTVRKKRHLEYWRNQGASVFLVIRTLDGNIRWMDVSAYLQNSAERGEAKIVFDGEPFTALSVIEVRDRVLQACSERDRRESVHTEKK